MATKIDQKYIQDLKKCYPTAEAGFDCLGREIVRLEEMLACIEQHHQNLISILPKEELNEYIVDALKNLDQAIKGQLPLPHHAEEK